MNKSYLKSIIKFEFTLFSGKYSLMIASPTADRATEGKVTAGKKEARKSPNDNDSRQPPRKKFRGQNNEEESLRNTQNNLLWVDKYRPRTLEDIIGCSDVAKKLQ